MSKMIQVRNVPDAIHNKLKTRAAKEGMSLSDYLVAELRALTQRPTVAELCERLARRGRINPSPSTVEMIRAERDHR